jgi:hypothetical protein
MERYHLEDPDVDGRITLKLVLQEVGWWVMGWIALVEDRDRWRTLMKRGMNLRVSWNVGNFLTSWGPVSFSERTVLHGVIWLVSNSLELHFIIILPYKLILRRDIRLIPLVIFIIFVHMLLQLQCITCVAHLSSPYSFIQTVGSEECHWTPHYFIYCSSFMSHF